MNIDDCSSASADDRALAGFPKIPLPEFRDDDKMLKGLPPSLYGHLQKALLWCKAPSEERMDTLKDAEAIMRGVMEAAEKLKIQAMHKLRLGTAAGPSGRNADADRIAASIHLDN